VAILDLAVIALAVMVCVTLGLLAWTLGVTVPAAVRRARHDVARARSQVAQAEARLRRLADRQGGR
jgi:hypothetical protein